MKAPSQHLLTGCETIASVANAHVNKLKGSQRKIQDEVPGWNFHDITTGPWIGGWSDICDPKDDTWFGTDWLYKGNPYISTKLNGKGRAMLVFGNCNQNGDVTLYKRSAVPGAPWIELKKIVENFKDESVEFEYEDGDEIKIAADGYATIAFRDFKELSCSEGNKFSKTSYVTR